MGAWIGSAHSSAKFSNGGAVRFWDSVRAVAAHARAGTGDAAARDRILRWLDAQRARSHQGAVDFRVESPPAELAAPSTMHLLAAYIDTLARCIARADPLLGEYACGSAWERAMWLQCCIAVADGFRRAGWGAPEALLPRLELSPSDAARVEVWCLAVARNASLARHGGRREECAPELLASIDATLALVRAHALAPHGWISEAGLLGERGDLLCAMGSRSDAAAAYRAAAALETDEALRDATLALAEELEGVAREP